MYVLVKGHSLDFSALLRKGKNIHVEGKKTQKQETSEPLHEVAPKKCLRMNGEGLESLSGVQVRSWPLIIYEERCQKMAQVLEAPAIHLGDHYGTCGPVLVVVTIWGMN